MNFPPFVQVPFVKQDGFLTDAMNHYHDQTYQALQNGLSDNGWTAPLITAANLTKIEPDMPNGTIWIVEDISPQQLVVKLSGALRKVTTTAYP